MAIDTPTATAKPFRRIVWPLAVAQTILWAGLYYVFPALLLEWERDLGWSKAELSGAFTLALLVAAAMAPAVGRIIDRDFGRSILAGSAILGALLLMLLSRITALWQFYAVWIGLGAAMSCGLYEACFAFLTRVLGGQARQAITLVSLVAGFAGTVAFPSAHALTGILGWRGALQVFSGVVTVVALPLILYGGRTSVDARDAPETVSSRSSFETVHILKHPRYWLLALAYIAIALDHGVLLTHLLPLLAERNVHSQTAVLAAAMIGPMQVVGRLAVIAAGPRASSMGIFIACYLAMAIAAISLLGAQAMPVFLAGFILFQGAGYGITSIMRPVMTAELLGRRNFGVISGFLALPFLSAAAVAPTVAALVWTIGGYDLVIRMALCVSLLGLAALLAAAAIPLRTPS